MKILVSWIAYNNDFLKEENKQGNRINHDGPTFNFHRDFFKHDKHIILSRGNSVDGDTKVEYFASELRKEFPSHNIELSYIDLMDIIDMREIKTKVEGFLLRNCKDDSIDIFFSPGTSAMQIAWYIIHESEVLNTHLYQVRPKQHSRVKKSELLEIKTTKSSIPSATVIKEESVNKHKEDYLITNSLIGIYSDAEMIANADKVIALIYGESGTGKEHLARYIHKQSVRKGEPFIAVNCSAFTDELLESRLFGHKKGAFTGATADHKGFFEEAKGGAIFLDEIGDISPYMQQSLLRVLQENTIHAIGENKERKVDVRVIAATNKDLPALCSEGKFRWDLYYRLAVAELTLPPLRERGKDELRELIKHFLLHKQRLFNRPQKLVFEKDALSSILVYPFPGNVRELENLIESLYVFNTGTVKKGNIPDRFLHQMDEFKLDLKSVEKAHILKVLKMKRSDSETAKILGVAINTLKSKMKKYDLS